MASICFQGLEDVLTAEESVPWLGLDPEMLGILSLGCRAVREASQQRWGRHAAQECFPRIASMAMQDDSGVAPTQLSVPRACDACRSRKVKCDKGAPCANCKSSGSLCRTTKEQNKEQRSRVIISKEYEKKIDRIGDRLANIEEYLKRLPARDDHTDTGGAALSHSSANTGVASTHHDTDQSAATTSEQTTPADYSTSDATTGAHSAFASRVVEQAVGSNPAVVQNAELAAALGSLKGMLGKINETPSTSELKSSRSWYRSHAKRQLPTPAEIQDILQRADHSLTFIWVPSLSSADLKAKCKSVFDRSQHSSALRRVLVYGMLYNLCMEYSGFYSSVPKTGRFSELAAHFINELEDALEGLPLALPAKQETVEALIIGASAAIEMCKPHLALTLTTAAANIVLTLSYHRESTMKADNEQTRQSKIFYFWMVYIMDTAFSIRLGRMSVIRDCDIDVPMLDQSSGLPGDAVDVLRYWIDLGKISGHIIEQLYSPSALRQTLQQRSNSATGLAHDLEAAWEARRKTAPQSDDTPPGFHHLLYESDAILHYSTLALVQHATMSSSLSESPALGTARHALKLTTNLMDTQQDLPEYVWAAYCHWALLHAPFTPFTVTFCHVIANPTTTHEELALLASFVKALEALSHLSDGVTKLHRLCDVFQKVAELYVQAKTQEASRTTVPATTTQGNLGSMEPAINDIDGYLSTIGFAPPVPTAMNGDATDASLDQYFDADYLNEWFSGNSSLMGLLEQDLTLPNDSGFGYLPNP